MRAACCATTAITVTVASVAVGFESLARFSRAYRPQYGRSPGTDRRQRIKSPPLLRDRALMLRGKSGWAAGRHAAGGQRALLRVAAYAWQAGHDGRGGAAVGAAFALALVQRALIATLAAIWGGSSHALKDCGDALAAADAHGHQGVAALDALQLVQRLDGDQRARGADGVAQRDARAIGVDLGRVGASPW